MGYGKIQELLKDYNIVELNGIEPNPRIETVRRGVELCRENNIEVILAVGGGSTIDCSKVVAAGYYYEGDTWDIVIDSSKITNALPIVTVLTLAATGSEMNSGAVISKMDTNEKLGTRANCMSPKTSILDPEYLYTLLTLAATGSEMNSGAVISKMDTNEKLGTRANCMSPKTSILDPEYLYTLPAIQTAAGTADIMSHVFENYFKKDKDAFVQDKIAEGLLQTCIKYCPIALKDPAAGTADIMSHVFENYFKKDKDAFVQDKIAEGLLQTCIKYCPIALKDPANYEARANLMWASSMALNGLTGSGKVGAWSCHPMEHELSAHYDITHGVGLAILTPSWMRYILKDETLELSSNGA